MKHEKKREGNSDDGGAQRRMEQGKSSNRTQCIPLVKFFIYVFLRIRCYIIFCDDKNQKKDIFPQPSADKIPVSFLQ